VVTTIAHWYVAYVRAAFVVLSLLFTYGIRSYFETRLERILHRRRVRRVARKQQRLQRGKESVR
jgi:hypothetical protein